MKMFNIFRATKASTGQEECDDMSTGTGGEGRKGDVEDPRGNQGTAFIHAIYILIAHIFARIINLLPMPEKKVPNYNLTAINPYRRVPYPPLTSGTETGLVCKSKSCRTRPTHSTVYFKSQHKHLTGVKCPIDSSKDGLLRTYNTEHFQEQLRLLNRRVVDSAATVINNSVTTNDFMEIHRLMNAPPTPPATQASTSTTTERSPAGTANNSSLECKGVNGHIAAGHQTRKNERCPVNACKACCLALNTSGLTPCPKHNSMAKRQQKEIEENGRVSIIPSLPNRNIIDIISSPSVAEPGEQPKAPLAITQGGRSNGVRKYKGKVQTDFLDEYRRMSLEQKAAARKRTAKAETASKTIALVVWAGSEEHPLGYWGGWAHAASWPDFCLAECNEINELVAQQLGANPKAKLQVWNEDNQLWLHTSMDIVVTYPVKIRKILVVFPGLDPSECNDVDRHLASVSTGDRKASMTMAAFIQRKESVTPKNKVKGKARMINLVTPPEPVSQQITPRGRDQSTPTQPSETPDDNIPTDSSTRPPLQSGSHQGNKRLRSPSIDIGSSSTLTNGNDSSNIRPAKRKRSRQGPMWSNVATMAELSRLYLLTLDGPQKLNNKEAFDVVFGTRFTYATSTISHYVRWCEDLDHENRLAPFVARNSNMKVANARQNHFLAEWRRTDSRFDNAKPVKQVKL
ncbi:uncharacterized protein MELLADRAFT_95504 [Melampsora larici-populina 98AG31]|uniref:Uncharacterized protein n=1 Tax=Melampsora larici-populina (strain 98AG31 / pathotype 3-4-7) TaxID=747676 RepID=F4S9K9_MELLP|nr:uncharacterized protein MELLADRAFT_95504 [Melampsora larici-populina 98AG31]EGF98656.1 hypothetical protein MELLADRAFT_95504 [Melampsora larici-populina 98AG31]